ncbi:MAG: hypothetical protein LBO06_01660 [Bacteroidales bacterium]|jgi:hypothetical protein|nr:hypothetical protein [Bacteroidales bacterium]
MKRVLYLTLVMLSIAVIAQAQEDLKPWTDVVIDSRNPSEWTWNKTESSRFMIRGDFDGDGFEENIYETATKLFSDNKELTDLMFGGDLGVYFLVNEGDLDGDGGDEISFMTVNRDFSNLNVFHVWTYTGNRWKELFQVPVHEWDCPNYKPTKPEEMFTYQWKQKNGYSMNKIVLKLQDGVIDVIAIHPCGRYAIEHIKIVNKFPTKREWGTIIQPRND